MGKSREGMALDLMFLMGHLGGLMESGGRISRDDIEKALLSIYPIFLLPLTRSPAT